MTFTDALEIFDLNLSDNVDFNNLKLSYRKKAFLCHPDRAVIIGKNKLFLENKFKELNDAYQVLLDKIQKEKMKNFDNFSNTYKYPNNQNLHKDEVVINKGFNRIKMRFAEFLYYKKVINYKTLLDSIVWQYKNRPKFGEIAIGYNFLSFDQILFLLKNYNYEKKIGEQAINNNMIDIHRVYIILGKQRDYKLPIGKYFVEKNILTKESLDKYLKEHAEYNFFSLKKVF